MNRRRRNPLVMAALGAPGHGSTGTYLCRSQVKGATGGAIVAALEAAAVASPRGSKSFVLPGAIVSLRSCPRGQARSGQDWKGAGNIGRWCGSSTMVRAAGAWTWTAFLDRSPADRLLRSSQGLCHGHWLAWWVPADGVRRTGPASARAQVRSGAQTGRFRSRRHDEVAIGGLLVDGRAQARSRIEDPHCR